MQIRSLRVPYPLIQTIVLPNIRHLVKSCNAVIVASENSICGLFPVPLGAQVIFASTTLIMCLHPFLLFHKNLIFLYFQLEREYY